MASSADASPGWNEWIAHTNFSFLTGASHPAEVVERAVALGYKGLAITDFDGAYGLARSFRALERLRKDGRDGGMRLFYGAELHLARDHELPVVWRDTIILIAQSHRGYFNLCRLLTEAHRGGKNGAHLPLMEILDEKAFDLEDLVAIQPMRGRARRAGWTPAAELELAARCAEVKRRFGPRFHLALSRHLHPSEDEGLQPTLRLARALDVPCLLSQDVFFHHPDRKSLSDLLHAIRCNRPVGEVTAQHFPNAERSLRDPAGLARLYADLGPVQKAAQAASAALSASIHFDLKELTYRYPQEMLPEGHTSQSYLEELSWASAKERFGGNVPEKIVTLLQHELTLVGQLGFADYFVTVWDIVRWARSQHILCQGRGSAANSAVCYVLGITAVDVSEHEMLFERFISVERGDPPDIDVDFEHERREEVIQYIYRRFGRDRAAMVANVITFESRGALRAVGKALGVAEVWLGATSQVLGLRELRQSEPDDALGEAKKIAAQKGVAEDPATVPWGLWGELAARLHGFPRHLGIHSGGFIVTDRALEWLAPREPATMENRTVVQWCKEDIEALDIFKIDILALGMLTAIRKCFTLVKDHYGKELTIAAIPVLDQPTYDMICRADTVGTFQVESRAQMSMLPRLKPRNLYELAIEVAIVRPGPIQGKMVHPFLRRRTGVEKIDYPDPRLEPILKRTMGVPIFQEQVMRIAMEVGGFSPGESNELRRHMGSFTMKGDLSGMIGKLEQGMRKNGLGEEFIARLMEQIKGFSHYGFPESHAISFALLAYVSSYLKQHYPAAFFTALLNSQPMGFYTPHALLQTAQHLGLEVRPPCALRSRWETTLERRNGERAHAIRVGLHLVSSLREESARLLVERRDRAGGFGTLEELLRQGRLGRVDLTALAAADALKIFGVSRRAALWIAEAAAFTEFLEDADVAQPAELPPESPWERATADFKALGTTFGRHPTALLREQGWCYRPKTHTLTPAAKLTQVRSGRNVVVFGMVLVRQMPPEAKGVMFATLEDDTGLINLIFHPQVRQRFRALIDGLTFLCVEGRIQNQDGAYSILVQTVHAPSLSAAEVVPLRRDALISPAASLAQERHLVNSRDYF